MSDSINTIYIYTYAGKYEKVANNFKRMEQAEHSDVPNSGLYTLKKRKIKL